MFPSNQYLKKNVKNMDHYIEKVIRWRSWILASGILNQGSSMLMKFCTAGAEKRNKL